MILPNLKQYEVLVREPLEEEGGGDVGGGLESGKREEAEAVLTALVGALQMLEEDVVVGLTNGYTSGDGEEQRQRLSEKVGSLIAGRIVEMERPRLVKAILES